MSSVHELIAGGKVIKRKHTSQQSDISLSSILKHDTLDLKVYGRRALVY